MYVHVYSLELHKLHWNHTCYGVYTILINSFSPLLAAPVVMLAHYLYFRVLTVGNQDKALTTQIIVCHL